MSPKRQLSLAGSQRNGRAITKGKTHYNFAHDPKILFNGEDWRKRRPGQPFFAQFQITEPHRPFPIPTHYDEAALAAIKLPSNYPEHPLSRRDWYAYERSVEVVDQRVGAILAQLEAEGVLQNTVVMFFADHGRPMPWGKQWLSVEGLQVPLLIRGPGVTPRSVETGLVSLIDLAPSVLKAAGQPLPAWMEGRPVLQGVPADRPHLFAARDRCGDAMDRIRALISPDTLLVRNHLTSVSRLNWSSYKENSYPGMPLLRVLQATGKLEPFPARWLAPQRPEFEFYDLKADALGVRDVSADPANAETIRKQSTALTAWSETSQDQGLRGDPATEPSLAEIQQAKRQDYRRTWTRRLGKPEPTDAERLAWWEQSYGLAQGTLAK